MDALVILCIIFLLGFGLGWHAGFQDRKTIDKEKP